MKKAIYPGSFDPLHEGHLNIIKKAVKIFDSLYVVVTNNPEKDNQTPISERLNNVKKQLNELENVIVEINEDQMTVEFAKQRGINFLIRSARNQDDYNYELELAAANHHLNADIETILLIPDYEKITYMSRLIKQGGK